MEHMPNELFYNLQITSTMVATLTEQQLVELGVTTIGDRHRLRAACRGVSSSSMYIYLIISQ